MNYAFFRVTGGSQSKRNGEQLFFKKRNLLQEVPFPVTEERIQFAESCRPSYEKWYPEVIWIP